MSPLVQTLPTPSPRTPVRRRGGLFGAAMVVDGVGTGMFMPFSVLYFLHTTSLALPQVGLALTAAGLLALPATVVAGPLIDRFGPLAAVVAGNLLCAGAFTGYLFVRSLWQLAVVVLLAAAGQTVFGTATIALIGSISTPQERPGWFARQSAARNAGYGVGALAGAAAVAAGTHPAYLLLAAVNAVSYLGAAALTLVWRGGAGHAAPVPVRATDQEPAPRYGTVLRDRRLLLLTAGGFGLVLCMNVLPVLLTVYLTEVLGRWAFLGGLAIAANTVLVVVTQTSVTRRAGWSSPVRVVRAAAAAWAVAFAALWSLTALPGWTVIVALAVAVAALTLAEMLYGPTAKSLALAIAPPRSPGRHLGFYQLSWSTGTALAPAILTRLLAQGHQWPWICLIAVCALAATALGRLRP
ncbi:MFS transporter [Streptantibioticus silvisoli]|uniref:MFS transporter n=1 Tax=Streptantibioticus silvisoli TaxID=2705255 RepID=A0ABT6VRK9_9ACTN|nr:MFS transporter [Streptantibioticus silvisoli]MDI5961133.1 MFS transporter [Streptantibioticus silvisoli]